MELPIEQRRGQDFINVLIEACWTDLDFKKRLINDSSKEIERVIGKEFKLENNQRLVVEDQSDSSVIYLNIPRKVNVDNLELTDEQLETVSGGEIVVLGVAGLGSYLICFGVGLAIGGAAVGVAALISD